MSAMGRLRKQYEWESNVPRCASPCQHYQPSKTYLVNSLPRTTNPLCKLGGFTTRPNACCKHWTDGKTVLE